MPAFRPAVCRAALVALATLALVPAGSSFAQVAQGSPGRPQAARPGGERAAARLALVIGNAAYKDGALANPVNDARAMAEALRESGFKVMLHTDLDQRRMTQAVREFGDALRKGGGVGLFYFAGHGVQIKGRNYLVPIGADIQREDEVAYAALDAQAVLDKMEAAGNGTNVLILDACRNNPFARSFRSASAGLAQMDAPVGTLVAFATAPGMVASDGTGRNGLYTQYLLDAMRKPGLKVEEVFKQVRVGVRRDSGGKQVPWESTSLEGDLYFTDAPAVVAAAAATPSPPGPAAAPATAAAAVPAPASLAATAVTAATSADGEEARRRVAALRPSGAPVTPASPSPVAAQRPAEEPALPEPPPRLALLPAASPPSAGVTGPPTTPSVGDTWSFRVVDQWSNTAQRHFTVRVAKVAPGGEVLTTSGSRYDALMRAIRLEDMAGDRLREYVPHLPRGWEEWHPGRSTPVKFADTLSTLAGVLRWRCENDATVRHVRVERVRVPAGEFNARRYEIEGTCQRSAPGQSNSSHYWRHTVWYVPELRYHAALEVERRTPEGKLDVRTREELTSYQVSMPAIASR